MTAITIIKNQINLVKEQTDELIGKIRLSDWNNAPKIIETNMNWQIGHITLANYLHGVASISGSNEAIKNRLNITEFIKCYGPNSIPTENDSIKPSSKELMEMYNLVFVSIWTGLDQITESDLSDHTAIPNPRGKTKYDALTTLFRHQSWHNGQIAMLNRVLHSQK